MKRGLTHLKTTSKPKTTFLCLSNANSVYISTVLNVRYRYDFAVFHTKTLTLSAGE